MPNGETFEHHIEGTGHGQREGPSLRWPQHRVSNQTSQLRDMKLLTPSAWDIDLALGDCGHTINIDMPNGETFEHHIEGTGHGQREGPSLRWPQHLVSNQTSQLRDMKLLSPSAWDIDLVCGGCGHTIHIDTLNEETSDDHIANNRLEHLQGSTHRWKYRQE